MLPGFTLQEQLYSGNSLVYRARRDFDGASVVLKFPAREYPEPRQIQKFHREFSIARRFEAPGVARYLEAREHKTGVALILEDFGAISLAEHIDGRPLPLEECLQIASRLAEALGLIHDQDVVHRDVKPRNVLIHPPSMTVKISDFGISSEMRRERQSADDPGVLRGTLLYIAPEQTGRMNRSVDYRADFYSLGAALYEMATGRPPFVFGDDAADAMELLHCHIARRPRPPRELRPDCPPALEGVILKLLEKNAENRYLSAHGLRADLERIESGLLNGETELDFAPGERDVSGVFHIPERLYGREGDLACLGEALNQAGRSGPGGRACILLSGEAGVGKSALADEWSSAVAAARGYFASGKFDQVQRNIPYQGLVRALRGLFQQILSESEARLEEWRDRILAATVPNGALVIQLAPESERLLGPQPPAPELDSAAERNRFRLVFRNLMRALSGSGYPLAFFLDDLQWADPATLDLLDALFTDDELHGLCFVGAFRDNEVAPGDPLDRSLELWRQRGAIDLRLEALGQEDARSLAAGALLMEAEAAAPLADALFSRTGGNPFFLRLFLQSLYSDGVIRFESSRGVWSWNAEAVEGLGLADNVVQMAVDRLQKLGAVSEGALRAASALGAEFDPQLLALASDLPEGALLERLAEAARQELIYPISGRQGLRFAFLHDRIQQAAYSGLPEEERAALHLRIARIMLERLGPGEERGDALFDVCLHANAGRALLDPASNPEECARFARLNLTAARQARRSAAYAPGLAYAERARELLAPNAWESQYDLCLQIHNEGCEAALLATDFARMEAFEAETLRRGRTLLDRVPVRRTRVLFESQQNRLDNALREARSTLAELGVRIPERPGMQHVLLYLTQTRLAIGRRGEDELYALPELQDPSARAAAQIIVSASSAAYFASPLTLTCFALKATAFSARLGDSGEAAYFYGLYGLILCGALGDLEGGQVFGRLAVRVLDKYGADDLRCKTMFLVHAFIVHWKRPLRESLPVYLDSWKVGLNTGDLEYASGNALFYGMSSLLAGSELDRLEQELRDASGQMLRTGQQRNRNANQILLQAVLRLRRSAQPDSARPGETALDEAEALQRCEAESDRMGFCWLYFFKAWAAFFGGQNEIARDAIEAAMPYQDGAMGQAIVPALYFYRALIHADRAPAPSKEKSKADGAVSENRSRLRRTALRRLRESRKKLRGWARANPGDQNHRVALLDAEIARLRGERFRAEELYERAIESAGAAGFSQEEALANERAARYCLAGGKAGFARLYFEEAIYRYRSWGAGGIVERLEADFGEALGAFARRRLERRGSHGGFSSSSSSSDSLLHPEGASPFDAVTLLKSSQALSREIVLENLLEELLRIAIENAGAERGLLVLPDDGDQLLVHAGASVRAGEEPAVWREGLPAPVDDCDFLSAAVVRYAARTHETVALDDATDASGMFARDAYVKRMRPRSLLCLPIVRQNRLIGALYLENNLAPGAFTAERLDALQLLSAQAAISLENARLYATLEQRVEERTRELRDAQARLVQLEKEATERQMAGGFAHEMRNALAGSRLLLDRARGNDRESAPVSLPLQNVRMLKNLYEQLRETLPSEELETALESMRAIFSNEEELDEILQIVDRAATRGLLITRLILEYSRLGEEQEPPEELDLGATLFGFLEDIQEELARESIVIASSLERGFRMRAHEAHLYSVLRNLIWNARDALRDSETEAPRVEVQLQRSIDGRSAELIIRDNGPGVSPEIRERIFETFFSTKPETGAGLGLGIVRKIVQLYGGTIRAENASEGGAVFRIELPLHPTPPDAGGPASLPTE